MVRQQGRRYDEKAPNSHLYFPILPQKPHLGVWGVED